MANITTLNGSDYIDYAVLNDNFSALGSEVDSIWEDIETPDGYNVLWTGASYMNANQRATLKDNVTNQNHGIVLAWSGYSVSDSSASNSHWNYFFVPKWHVKTHNGNGIFCPCIDGTVVGRLISKYVYVYDTYINGHSRNNTSSATSNGTTVDNRLQVLRAVIGV